MQTYISAFMSTFSTLLACNITVAIGHFQYIKIQLDSKALRTQTKEMNKLGNLISFVVSSTKPHC